MQRGSWYAWSMFPGYGSKFVPYVCPIKILGVTPEKSGASTLMLEFFNSGYASGVQDFRLRLRVLARLRHYLIAELLYGPDSAIKRHAVAGRIGSEWLELNGYGEHGLSINDGNENDDLAQSKVDNYLDTVFRLDG